MAGKPRTNTNLNLYRSFLAVYETKSIRAAADMAGITHSAVSQNISALTKQMGLQLFHSQARGMMPTSYADVLYPIIKEAMNSLDGAEDKVKHFTKDSPGIIRIVCTTNFAGNYITPHILKFRNNFPNVAFEILNKNTEEALDMLEKGHAHIMLSVIPFEKIKGFKVIELETFQQTFFTTRKFGETNNIKDTITISEFNKLPFIALRTLGNFIDSNKIKSPDISAETQEILAQVFTNDVAVTFGAWEIAKKVLGDSIVRFNVSGITPQDATMVVAIPEKDSPKAILKFVESLTS